MEDIYQADHCPAGWPGSDLQKGRGTKRMSNLLSHGILSVEEMNALFEDRLRVSLPGGSFVVVQRSYSNASGSQVYDQHLSYSMTIRLKPEGHILPLNPVPVMMTGDSLPRTGKGSRAN